MSGPDVEGVLGRHGFLSTTRPYGWCACGKSFKRDSHRAHVAAALRAEVRAWLESEGAVSMAVRAANDAPNGAWLVLPGPVNIARSLVQPALAALAEQVGQVASVGEGEG